MTMKSTPIDANCFKSMNFQARTKLYKALLFVVVCVLAIMIAPSARGQATGSFSGNLADKSGGAIPSATVTVTAQETGQVRTTKTDSTGHYLVPLLPVGLFTVKVDAAGFNSAETKDLRLQVDEARELDFTLVPKTVVETVAVEADAVAVETANPSLGQVITSQEVSQLPLNGRDFVQLATLTAGATAETNPGSFFNGATDSEVSARGSFSLSVGGSRPNSTDWLLDGVDNNELTAGGIGVFSSIDDIAEFKVLTYTYSAEFGTRAGPTVLVTTKSGTNNFHGSLYEFVRNTDLDARSDFATSTPKFNLNQFGGSVGGPILRNKAFFFVDGEQKYQREGIVYPGLVPTQEMINGDFTNDPWGNAATTSISNPYAGGESFQCVGSSTGTPIPAGPNGSQAPGVACNKIPSNLISSIGQGLMKLYPAVDPSNPKELPVGDYNQGYNYVTEPVRSLNETKFDARLDETFGAKDNAFARFSYDQAFTYAPGGAPPPSLAEGNPFGSNETLINHARNIGIGESHVFSPNMLNQASVGYDRIFDYIASQDNFSCESTLLGIPNADLGCSASGAPLPGGAYSQGLVSVEVYGGYWSLGDRGYSPFQGGTNIYSFKDVLDLIRGHHEIRTGLDLRYNQMNVGTEAFQDGFWLIGNEGFFSGNPESDLLLGMAGGAIHDQTYDGAITGRRWSIYRPFVEDDWRVTPSLTLNLGLAWDMTTPEIEVHNRMANYLPSLGYTSSTPYGTLQIAGQNGISRSAGINMYWGAYEPRVGLTWKVMGSDKTVLRLGFGIYHDSAWSQGAQGLWQNPPNLGESDNFDGPVSLADGFQALPSPQTAATFTGSFNYQPRNFQPGRVHQYNGNIERQLPGDILLTAGYAGSVGGHLLVGGNSLNTDSPSACVAGGSYKLGCNPDGSPYFYPYGPPNFNSIFLFGDVGKTHYNSMQIKAETKSPRHGLYALLAYTYSRTYDNGLSDGLGSELSAPYFPLPNWQNLDWSLSQINLDQSFSGSVIYDLPFGKGRTFGGNWNPATNAVLGGWQATLIERVSSGFAVPLIDSQNNSGVFFEQGGNDNNYNRPDQVSGKDPQAANHGQHQWININAFAQPADGELGDAARVPVTGPDFVNSDFSVVKDFALPWHESGLNFRAEFFNLFNHPELGMPINDINEPGFGAVDSTVNNPRLVQLALKLSF
ncbi:MAG: carboxypeptidase-like regulatory domain-containing protein [Terracidiphilus sp.]